MLSQDASVFREITTLVTNAPAKITVEAAISLLVRNSLIVFPFVSPDQRNAGSLGLPLNDIGAGQYPQSER
jgi:hypothetical protein